MADQSVRENVSGTATGDFQDSVTETYLVKYDTVHTNFYSALSAAQSASGQPVPTRLSQYGGSILALLFLQNITGAPVSKNKYTLWQWQCTYTPPPQGQTPDSIQQDNPLQRPPVYNIDYMDREYVVEEAKNVETLSHGDGKGGNRAAGTLGPIVNAAGKRPDEPIVETERLEVLVIRKNFATLAEIVNLNRAFKRTTNSDSVQGYTARELRYLLCESLGQQLENGFYFWPGEIRILAEDTTDLILDNVGYEYWSTTPDPDDWKRAVDADGEPMSDPINLKLDGDKGGDNTTTITYRHLTEKAYAPLFA